MDAQRWPCASSPSKNPRPMNSTEHNTPQWFCVRCQTKREHIAAGHLREIEGIEVFCPRLRYRKATRRGKIWWVEPMFPGYVLAKFSIAEMERAVMFCQGVRGLVRFGSEIPAVPESFVEAMKHEIRNRQGADQDELVTLSPVPSATERVKILLEFLGTPQAVDMDLFSILLPRRPMP